VVLEQGENQHLRLTGMAFARKLAEHGDIVYHWPEQRPPEKAQVVVVRVEVPKKQVTSRGDRESALISAPVKVQ